MNMWIVPVVIFLAIYGINMGSVMGRVHSLTSNGNLFREKDYRKLLSNCIYAIVANTGLLIVYVYSNEARILAPEDGNGDEPLQVTTWFYVFAVALALFYHRRLERIRNSKD